MSNHDNRYEFIKKLGVGFENVFETVENLGSEYYSENYPPYNVVKADAETYVVQVSMAGYSIDDILINHKNNVLTVKAKGSDKTAEEIDDVFFHKGIRDGENYIKFVISKGLKFAGAVLDEGILYLTYKTTASVLPDGDSKAKDAAVVAEEVVNFLPSDVKVKADRHGRPGLKRKKMGFRKWEYDSAGRPVAILDEEGEEVDVKETEAVLKTEVVEPPVAAAVVAPAVESVTDENVVPEKPVKAKAKKEKKESAPVVEDTIEVVVPETKPQIVEVKVTDNVIELADATVEVSDDVELSVVKTEKGKSDLVVAVKKEDKEKVKEVDLAEVVKEADLTPDLPVVKNVEKETVLIDKDVENKPTVEVTVPKEVTSVVSVKLDEKPTSNDIPAIVIEDSSEDIDEEAELIPVITPAGQPDIVIAVDKKVKEKLDEVSANTVEVVTSAIAKVNKEVVPVVEVNEEVVEEASDVEVVDDVNDLAVEPKVVLVNKEKETPTVQVTSEVVEEASVVEVKLDPVGNTESKVTGLKVVDATVEVSDEAVLSVVKTEEGEADIVVAVTPEVKEVLEKESVTVEEIVKPTVKAPVIANEIVDEVGEVIEPVSKTVLVDKTDEEKPTVEVKTKDVIEQVVKVELIAPEIAVDSPAIELVNSTENVSETAELVPVVSAAGQPDVVVAIEPETKKALEEAGVANTAEVVEKAINQLDVVVAPTAIVDEEAVEVASEVEEVVEKLDAIAVEPATIIVNTEETPVEVTLAAEESPQIVEVKLDEKPSNVEVPAIVVADATVEVSDDVELIPVKTEEGKSDLVVAVNKETKETLEASNIVVEEVVKEALEVNDAVPELPVETVVAAVEGVKVNDVTVEVPELVSQIVEVKKEDNVLVLTDTSPAISEEVIAVLPVITPAGQPDVVVAVDKSATEDKTVEEVKEIVEKAVNDVEVEVETVVAVDPVALEEASANMEVVAEEPVEPAKKPVVISKKTSNT